MADIRLLKDHDIPPLLREIPDAPEQLYLVGSVPDPSTHTFLAVVGSRKNSQYGREACEKLIEGLRGYPIVIISGLAYGIDAIAHEAALKNNLKTIAVPGSGLAPSVLYPTAHTNLAQRIVEAGGALISEFEPEFKATPWSFPKRNRIMAGMSHAVLIIEAEQKSGTLITSKLATEYNRDVLTVPGSIFSSGSEGPQLLIRLGATPISSSKELLEALHFKAADINRSIPENCSPLEIQILELLREPLSKEDLIVALDIPITEANITLSTMELKGLITESLGLLRRA
jgi:DNA processing protein